MCNYLIRLYFSLTCHDLIQAYLCLRLVWGTTCSDLIPIYFCVVGQYTLTYSELTPILLDGIGASLCTYFLRSCSNLIYVWGNLITNLLRTCSFYLYGMLVCALTFSDLTPIFVDRAFWPPTYSDLISIFLFWWDSLCALSSSDLSPILFTFLDCLKTILLKSHSKLTHWFISHH